MGLPEAGGPLAIVSIAQRWVPRPTPGQGIGSWEDVQSACARSFYISDDALKYSSTILLSCLLRHFLCARTRHIHRYVHTYIHTRQTLSSIHLCLPPHANLCCLPHPSCLFASPLVAYCSNIHVSHVFLQPMKVKGSAISVPLQNRNGGVTDRNTQLCHLVPSIHEEFDGLLKNNVLVFHIISPLVSPTNIQKLAGCGFDSR